MTATGSISSAVTLHTDSPRRPDVNVLVQAHFRTPVTVTPQAVVVASDESGEVVKSVTISGLRPIQVEAVRGPAAVRTTLVQDSPSSWRIEVRFPADTPLDGPNTALTFNVRSTDTTDAAEARAVAIPLHRLPPSRRGVP